MSGGFFRGTSAYQDTRFSNKQAKLMKSQKFPPELEHLVDVTKVSMDVMRPWIANRVTELLGFEDEVLINFIYGLLDGKEVNGKEVQIQLTGFMEKNTGKFMKELWTLLLSGRKNASGVPQQFLDAKQEETKKRKEEADRLANEIQRKKDKETQELEEERSKKIDGGIAKKASNASLEANSKHTLSKASSDRSEDEKITDKRNGVRAINGTRSPSRSISKSHSNSRSDYGSRSVSRTNEKSPRVRQSSSSPMSRSPPRCRIASEDKSPYKSHVGQAKELMTGDASSSPPRKFRENRESSEKEKRGNHKSKPMEKRLQNSTTSKQKDSALNVCYREYSPERFSTRGVVESRSDQNDVEIRSKDQEKKREKKETPRTPYLQKSPMMHKDSLPDERKHPPYPGADGKSDENRSYSKSMKGSSRHHKSEFLETSIECVRHSKHGSASDYGSEEMDKHKDADKELRKHKRSRREAALDDDHSYDSDTEDRKEAKRRMKEENRLQKEKKRQQREGRCWKRLERRAEKQKGKNQNDASASDGEDVTGMECYSEDTVSEQKRLETELRKKALESLKTKKGISH